MSGANLAADDGVLRKEANESLGGGLRRDAIDHGDFSSWPTGHAITK